MQAMTIGVGFELDLRDGGMHTRRGAASLLRHGLDTDTREAWLDSIHPDDRAAVETSLDDAICGDDMDWSTQYRVVLADGTVRLIAVSARIERDLDGLALAVVGDDRDVPIMQTSSPAESPPAEPPRTSTQARAVPPDPVPRPSLAIFTGMRDAAFIADIDRDPAAGRATEIRLVATNPALDALLDQPPGSAAGRELRAVIPDVPDAMIEVLDRVSGNDDVVAFSARFDALGGRWFDGRAFRVDAHGRVAALFSDVTEIRRRDAELHDSRARLQLVQDVAACGAWEWDIASGRQFWSQQAFIAWGRGAPAGNDTELPLAQMLSWVVPEDRERLSADLARALEGFPFRISFTVVTLSGERRRISGRSRYVVPDATHPRGRLLGAYSDITSLQRLTEHASALEQTVEARTREARQAHGQADQARDALHSRLTRASREEALGHLAGGIAHALDDVLQAAHGVLTLIDKGSGDTEAVRRYAKLGLEAVGRGVSLTHRVLAVARAQAGTAHGGTTQRGTAPGVAAAGPEPLDVPGFLGDLREVLAGTLGAGIDVRLSLGAEVPSFIVDRARLGSVLINLAAAARASMPAGGTITLAGMMETVPAAAAADHPAGLSAGTWACIAVIDDGPGLTADTLAGTTDSFAATSPDAPPIAVPAAMARALAETSGGRCLVDSEPRIGTVVSLYFPPAPDPATTQGADGVPDAAPL